MTKKNEMFDKKISDKAPVLLFLLLVMATVFVTYLSHRNFSATVDERFMRVSGDIALSIQNRMLYYSNSLRQTAALFMSSDLVTKEEFTTYTTVGLGTEYPGISGIAYIENKGQGKATLMRLKTFQDHLVPDLSGANFTASPAQQAAMKKAASIQKPQMSDATSMFDQTKTSSPKGFAIYLPVYENASAARGQTKIKGFVVGLFNVKHLFDSIITRNNYFQKALGVDVYIKEDRGIAPIYQSSFLYGPTEHAPLLTGVSDFDFAGKTWLFEIYTLPLIEGNYQAKVPWLILVLGLLLSLLVLFVSKRLNKAKNVIQSSERKMRKAATESGMLAQVGEKLGKMRTPQNCLNQMGDFFANNFADICVIETIEEDRKKKIIRASENLKTSTGESRLKLINLASEFVERHKCERSVREKEAYVAEELGDDESFKSYISLPIAIRDDLFGVITLLCRRNNKNNYEDRADLLSHLVNVSSIFIANTLLYEEAELANRLKDEFLATVSHELRTPLGVIYGHSQLLLESELEPDYKGQVRSIFKAAKAQSTIIEDLLDVSAIISGKVAFDPRPVKVMNAIDTALESVKLEAKEKGVELIFDEAHQCIVMGVKTRLVQIFWNLLSNAIKFTPEGGKVAVKSTVEGQNCVIKVIDTGKGIEPDFLPYIFEKFKQEDKTNVRNRGGLGLGLSIASHLVSLHGGSIKAESEGKNKGSIFTVSLPVVSLTTKTGPSEKKEKLEQIEKHDLHEVRVLAVDDEPESLNLIARILRSYKANVITAENGVEALKKLKTERPDVLISDIAMPEMDGYELIKEIRQKERAQGTHIPAIALTAFAQEEDKERALSSGYEAYLSKPVNKEKLIGTVEQALH